MSCIVDQIGKSMKEDLTRDPKGDDPDPTHRPEDASFLVAGAPSPLPSEEAEDIELEPPFVSAARGADEPAPASASAAAAAEPEPAERRGS